MTSTITGSTTTNRHPTPSSSADDVSQRNFQWTGDEDDKLRDLLHSGATYLQAAKILNRSRNSIAGRASRLGIHAAVTDRPKKSIKRKKTVEPKVPEVVEPVIVVRRTNNNQKSGTAGEAILKLGPYDCRWPIGDPLSNNFHYCGEYAEPGQPYCETHRKLAAAPKL